MTIPTDSDDTDEKNTEYVVESQEDFVARQSLQLLYRQLQQTTEQMSVLRQYQAKGVQTEAQLRDMRVALVDLLALLRPQMQDDEVWEQRDLGTMAVSVPDQSHRSGRPGQRGENTEKTVTFYGLGDLYKAREGVQHKEYQETPGIGRDTDVAQTTTEPPYHVLANAFDAVQDWMSDNDLGLPIGADQTDHFEL